MLNWQHSVCFCFYKLPIVRSATAQSVRMDSKQDALKRKRIKSAEDSSDSDTEQKKPLCKYGEKCYQKNAYHLQKFRHPHRDNVVVKPSGPKLEVTILIYI